MPIKLTAPLEQEFILKETDRYFKLSESEEPTRIRIKQATQSANERRERVFKTIFHNTVGEDNEISYNSDWTMLELKRTEAYLTLVDCNIQDENGKPLFKFKKKGDTQILNMTEAEFAIAWGKLLPMIIDEIIGYVHEVNVSWASGGN